MNPDLLRARRLLYDDYALYARHALRIRTKTGRIEPLRFNAAQMVLHEAATRQRAELGYVRAIVLKARSRDFPPISAGGSTG